MCRRVVSCKALANEDCLCRIVNSKGKPNKKKGKEDPFDPFYWFLQEHRVRVGDAIGEPFECALVRTSVQALWNRSNPAERKPYVEKAERARRTGTTSTKENASIRCVVVYWLRWTWCRRECQRHTVSSLTVKRTWRAAILMLPRSLKKKMQSLMLLHLIVKVGMLSFFHKASVKVGDLSEDDSDADSETGSI